ncbi:hypothetical protein BOX15_Mlig011193g2 [Macrostomum lignano]|uniref:Uncharacterized protein n=2 Tax=Macrostomum lignano TaxID=282301 RepID=A0A267GKI9_9PLAT|nr:hypothetical protein BOX15_Mlig011193g2 [Macrostomum lignano]
MTSSSPSFSCNNSPIIFNRNSKKIEQNLPTISSSKKWNTNNRQSNHFREAEQDLSDMITPQRTESFTPAGRLFAQRMMQPGSSASRPSRQQQQPLLFALRSIHLNDYDNQPLLTRQLQQQAVKQDEQSRITDNWIIRDRDELYWFDCLTVWSRCHEPMQTFTTLSPVLAASFVSFPLYTEPFAAFDLASYTFYGKLQQQTKSGSGNVKVMSGVAMLENDCITFLSETGSEHRTRVPFPCQRMLAHSEGLLLEREIVVSNAATEDPNLPVLFSLSHPLDDVAPVLRLKQSAAPITVASSTAAVTNYFTSSCGKLVYVCQTTGAAFVLQEQQQQHMLSLYRLRYITDAELAAWHRQVRAQYLMMSTLAGTAAAGAAAPPGPVFDTPCVRIPPNQQQQPLSAIPKHLLPDSQRLSLSPGAAAKNIVSVQQQHPHNNSPLYTSTPSGGGIGSLLSPLRLNQQQQQQQFLQQQLQQLQQQQQQPCQQNQSLTSLLANTQLGQLDQAQEPSPIQPRLVLESVWTSAFLEQQQQQQQQLPILGKIFVAEDASGSCRYACYHLPRARELRCIRLNGGLTNWTVGLSSGDHASVPALDAVWVPNQRLIVTLEPPFGREFTLCSGPQQICRLALSDFDLPLVTQQQPHQSTPSTYSAAGGSTVPSGNNSMRRRLRDASLNAFNVQLGDCGSVIRRVILPPMSVGQLVSRCLDSLQQLLPKDAYLNLLRRWYTASHSPGSRDGNTISNEWHRFDEVLRESLDLIGTEDATISTSGCQLQQQSATTDDEDLAKRPRQSSGDADWYKLIEQSGGDRFDDLFKLAGVKGHFKGADSSAQQAADRSNRARPASAAAYLRRHSLGALLALHSVYEAEKLSAPAWPSLPPLARLLATLSARLGLDGYVAHYASDFPEAAAAAAAMSPAPDALTLTSTSSVGDTDRHSSSLSNMPTSPPYSIFAELLNKLKRALPSGRNPALTRQFPRIDGITDTCHLMLDCLDELLLQGHENETGRFVRLVELLRDRGFQTDALARLPFGVALPLLEALDRCRQGCPPATLASDAAACELLGRKDLSEQLARIKSASAAPLSAADNWDIVGEREFHLRQRGVARGGFDAISVGAASAGAASGGGGSTGGGGTSITAIQDAAASVESVSQGWQAKYAVLQLLERHPVVERLFPVDLRIREAYRMLQTVDRAYFVSRAASGADAHRLLEENQAQLAELCNRTLMLPVGMGALGLAIRSHRSWSAASFLSAGGGEIVPPLNTAGQSDNQRSVTLDAGTVSRVWGEFHNGVAAGLTYAPGLSGLDESWIWFALRAISHSRQLPMPTESFSSEQSGFLLGLGINGHLRQLATERIRVMLSYGDEMLTVATLLGLAASRRASMDESYYRTAALHVNALLPPSSVDMELPRLMHSAAVVGLGLVYQGSGHNHLASVLLAEIGQPAGLEPQNNQSRQLVATCSGLALGLICTQLGSGGDPGTAELLWAYMVGGRRRLPMPARDPRSTAGGPVNTGLGLAGNPPLPPHQPGSAGAGGGPQNDNQSNNQPGNGAAAGGNGEGGGGHNSSGYYDGLLLGYEASHQIYEGDSYNVEVTAPGAIGALALMYMGSEDSAVSTWLAVPDTPYHLDFVRPDLLQLRCLARGLVLWDQLLPDENWVLDQIPKFIKAAADVTDPTSATAAVDASLVGPAASACVDPALADAATAAIDWDLAGSSLVAAISGYGLAMGIRFAGTHNAAAFAALKRLLARLASLPRWMCRRDVEQASAVLLAAAACLMSGSGNLWLMRQLRRKRAVLPKQVDCGCQLMYAMATGILLLGGGRYTLSNRPERAALLTVALFPKLPCSLTDNSHHLQALRHLYALAAVPRVLCPVSLHSRRVVPGSRADITLAATKYYSELTYQVRLPCLLPDPSSVRRVVVRAPGHWPVQLDGVDSRQAAGRQQQQSMLQATLNHAFGYVLMMERRRGCLGGEVVVVVAPSDECDHDDSKRSQFEFDDVDLDDVGAELGESGGVGDSRRRIYRRRFYRFDEAAARAGDGSCLHAWQLVLTQAFYARMSATAVATAATTGGDGEELDEAEDEFYGEDADDVLSAGTSNRRHRVLPASRLYQCVALVSRRLVRSVLTASPSAKSLSAAAAVFLGSALFRRKPAELQELRELAQRNSLEPWLFLRRCREIDASDGVGGVDIESDEQRMALFRLMSVGKI